MNILVTGGSGAFGVAFVRAALQWPDVERVAVFSRDEHKHNAMMKLLGADPRDRLRFFLGDVRDLRRLSQAMHGVTHVIHAAALKIVPMLEYSPTEGVKTNVDGACNVVDAAIAAGVERVVGISTDKAVGPVNLYGATKLAAEKLFLAANALGGGRTSFSMVRYGNVTGSTGSVVPLWRPLAAVGETMPLTDDRMTRYWMTLPQAVEAVRITMFNGRGGEVVVPKLQTYRVEDLGKAIWEEAGRPGGWAAKFKAIGLRPGEKMHESLISEDEAPWAFDCGTHYEVLQPGGQGGPGGRVANTSPPGAPVPAGFRYRSDGGAPLSVEQLVDLLKTVPA